MQESVIYSKKRPICESSKDVAWSDALPVDCVRTTYECFARNPLLDQRFAAQLFACAKLCMPSACRFEVRGLASGFAVEGEKLDYPASFAELLNRPQAVVTQFCVPYHFAAPHQRIVELKNCKRAGIRTLKTAMSGVWPMSLTTPRMG